MAATQANGLMAMEKGRVRPVTAQAAVAEVTSVVAAAPVPATAGTMTAAIGVPVLARASETVSAMPAPAMGVT